MATKEKLTVVTGEADSTPPSLHFNIHSYLERSRIAFESYCVDLFSGDEDTTNKKAALMHRRSFMATDTRRAEEVFK